MNRKAVLLAILLIVSACSTSTPMMTETQFSDPVPVLSPPVQGDWLVVDSPGHDPFAFDLAAVDAPSRQTLRKSRFAHLLGRVQAADSYSWGKPVRSPVTGIVVDSKDGMADRDSLSLVVDVARMVFSRPELSADDLSPFAGNYVIIEADNAYVFLAHMKQGSVGVQSGDEISAGQILGEIGNSGFTLEPHLHLQLFDQVDDLLEADTPPFQVSDLQILADGEWRASENGLLPKGEIVRFE